jgi:hypothetical protein
MLRFMVLPLSVGQFPRKTEGIIAYEQILGMFQGQAPIEQEKRRRKLEADFGV